MKKITLLALIFGVASTLHAQDSKFRIGFKLNPNVSWMKPNDNNISMDGSRLRLGFGLNFDRMFTENYAIGTGLNIFTTGGEASYLKYIQPNPNSEVPSQVVSITRNYKLQYVEVPLTLKLRTPEMGYITVWGQFGVGLGVNVSAKANEEGVYVYQQLTNEAGSAEWFATAPSDSRNYSEDDIDIKDDIALFRTSLIAGGGIEYNLSGSTSLLFGVTFNNGFSDALRGVGVKRDKNTTSNFIRKDGENKPAEFNLSSRTNLIELNIGILF